MIPWTRNIPATLSPKATPDAVGSPLGQPVRYIRPLCASAKLEKAPFVA